MFAFFIWRACLSKLFRILTAFFQKKKKASNTPSTTEEATSQAVKPEVAQSLKPLPLPKTIRSQEEKAITTIDSDLIKFDQFVTIGSPPSQNPSMYTKKIAKFILDSRLRFPDAILLTCVGSFYEAYFDQAVEVAQLLNIKQAQYQFAGKTYPFSGFPIASLQKHLKTLVNEHNRIVAIAEQISTDEELERRIVRIITPGTITDENLIDDESYNYLLGIHQNQLAWLDVSTGSYFSTTCEGGESELLDQICRISPKEILISADSSFRIPPNSKAAKLSMLITKIKSDASISPDELSAEKLIGIYIKRNLLPSRAAIQPLCVDTFRHLKLDAEAIDSLEIIRTQNGKSAAGSLLSTISRTITRPGKRLLRDRIMSPSRVPAEIQSRLDLVGKLVIIAKIQSRARVNSRFDVDCQNPEGHQNNQFYSQ
ncbi:DNA mismatch repair ATPase msh1, variant 2 [Puccinia graminis f. sp. tritici]|uniref:DNA mismatch repair ATPase msh1, variant 2 n=1 Tax=Puccinia graminis f. sp. tritici TaxID=56615 RepID=A0A5B0RCB5_PUCGR|nr:DNA mismatch repair ATPase msh1, variant 2 [Puccinia graminis f. sp. tritici]